MSIFNEQKAVHQLKTPQFDLLFNVFGCSFWLLTHWRVVIISLFICITLAFFSYTISRLHAFGAIICETCVSLLYTECHFWYACMNEANWFEVKTDFIDNSSFLYSIREYIFFSCTFPTENSWKNCFNN